MATPLEHDGADADVGQIESTLQDLWRREAATAPRPIARVRTLNLVVRVEAANEAALHEVLAELPRRHPGRVLVLAVVPEGQEGSVSSNVEVLRATGGDSQATSEEIVLTAPAGSAGQLVGSLLPLIIPDLPTFLWWASPGIPMQDGLFNELSEFCDRTIVDTALSPGGGIPVFRAVAAAGTRSDAPEISDLSWGRIYTWRERTAQFFDGVELRDCLEAVTSVEVRYGTGSGSGGSSQAYLYLGWLASRLGWRLTAARSRGAEREIWFEGAGLDISGRLLQSAEGPAGIQAVVIRTGEDVVTEFELGLTDDGGGIVSVVRVPDGGERHRVTSYRAPTTGQVLFDELDSRRADEVFVEAVNVVASLPERVER